MIPRGTTGDPVAAQAQRADDVDAQPRLEAQRAFWDARAVDYADPRDPAERQRLAARLAHLPAEARPGPGTRLLDVGAGTGAIALHAAACGATVTALDVSPAMLARLRAIAAPLRVQTLCADWRAFDPVAAGCAGAFDLVVAQMVPSLRAPEDFLRMEACSRGWCVVIGWGRVRRHPWLEAAFAAHAVPWAVPAGVPLAADGLAALGHSVEPVYWPEAWPVEVDAKAALRDAEAHLRVRGAAPDRARLRALLPPATARGTIACTSTVEIGALAWRRGAAGAGR